ncbi:MAG: PAS domain S-box protein, partial [Microcoleus sp. Co-bin12]|nr:PAS domain S-box protein [Microcoleus sp. Co-bin12]
YTQEEILNISVFDWDAQWTKEELQVMLTREEIVPLFETRHRRKDGSEYDVEISWNRVEVEGEMMHFCICRDITERKQAEIDLQISQARFAGILEIASDAIISIHSNQQITLFNKGAERIFGYAAEEVLGKPLAMLMPSRLAGAHHQHVSHYAQNGASARQMAERGAIFGRRKDGTEFPAEASISKIEIDGEIIFTTFLRDITARQQAEEALRYQKEMFQTIVDRIPVMIGLFNKQGKMELLNPEFEKILGWSLEDWQQKDILAECYPDPVYCQSVLEHMLSATGKWKDLTTMTASRQQLETSWAHVRLSSGYFLGIGQDISDRKQKELALQHAMEAAESANRAKTSFLANMS